MRAVAESVSLKEASERVGVSPATLRRWAREGVIPEVDGKGEWTTAAVAHARIVARLRERGHKLEQIKEAGREGRLAYGYIEELFGGDEPRAHAEGGGRAHRPRARADRALLGQPRACPLAGSSS